MDKTAWLKDGKWGVFNHYLYYEKECGFKSRFAPEVSWNECVNCFNVKKYAKTLSELNTGYVIFTLMQGYEFLCAPNDTFNKITGKKPGEACSQRDLIMEISDELAKYGIPLMVYFPADGPYKSKDVGGIFGYHDRPNEIVTEEFVKKWSSVLEEYAVRYGDKVKGWWFDGCYPFFGFNEDLLKFFKDAVRKGNENAVVAFNNGVLQVDCNNPEYEHLVDGETLPWKKMQKLINKAESGNAEALKAFSRPGPIRYSIHDDYTAGEENHFIWYPEDRFTDGAQWHTLSFLGQEHENGGFFGNSGWGNTGSKYTSEELRDYVDKVNAKGGAVSIDIAIFRDGSFDCAQIEVLKALKDCRKLNM